ncbi:MAG TPA: DASS family sodium-coupled anion symporter [Candidatus Sulfotelmatobacter sp.]|nr:DASS family sodium-coupled anion symporter [Candidatus Sulfotelmatobacter sp.]
MKEMRDGTTTPVPPKEGKSRWPSLLLGLAILLVSLALPAPAGMKPAALRTLAVMVTTVLWWVTETLPIPVTAMVVPVMVHALGIMPLGESVRESFGDALIPFLVGVLGLSVAFIASGLGKRITFLLLSLSGTSTAMVIGVYFWVSFVISMFITDVAVVAMMIPVVIGLLKTIDAKPGASNLGRALMMAIMFGSTLGGVCTPAGVSANIIAMAFIMKNAKLAVGFLDWTVIATPIFVAVGFATWWLILKMFPPEIARLPYGREALVKELEGMGAWTTKEKTTLVVFLVAVVLWLTGDLTKIPIGLVSLLILAGITLPRVGVFRKWGELEKGIEWGAMLLVVGGFTLGVAASKSGLAAWVAQKALTPMAALPAFLQPAAVVLLVAIDSLGFSSFGAAASVNVPFIIAYAQQHAFPVLALAMAAGFAASTHFILVTESPSFVLPYAYGYFSFKDMARIGVWLTLISAVMVSVGLVVAGLPPGVPLPAK